MRKPLLAPTPGMIAFTTYLLGEIVDIALILETGSNTIGDSTRRIVITGIVNGIVPPVTVQHTHIKGV